MRVTRTPCVWGDWRRLCCLGGEGAFMTTLFMESSRDDRNLNPVLLACSSKMTHTTEWEKMPSESGNRLCDMIERVLGSYSNSSTRTSWGQKSFLEQHWVLDYVVWQGKPSGELCQKEMGMLNLSTLMFRINHPRSIFRLGHLEQSGRWKHITSWSW